MCLQYQVLSSNESSQRTLYRRSATGPCLVASPCFTRPLPRARQHKSGGRDPPQGHNYDVVAAGAAAAAVAVVVVDVVVVVVAVLEAVAVNVTLLPFHARLITSVGLYRNPLASTSTASAAVDPRMQWEW